MSHSGHNTEGAGRNKQGPIRGSSGGCLMSCKVNGANHRNVLLFRIIKECFAVKFLSTQSVVCTATELSSSATPSFLFNIFHCFCFLIHHLLIQVFHV